MPACRCWRTLEVVTEVLNSRTNAPALASLCISKTSPLLAVDAQHCFFARAERSRVAVTAILIAHAGVMIGSALLKDATLVNGNRQPSTQSTDREARSFPSVSNRTASAHAIDTFLRLAALSTFPRECTGRYSRCATSNHHTTKCVRRFRTSTVARITTIGSFTFNSFATE